MFRISSQSTNRILKNVATSSHMSVSRVAPNGSVVSRRSFFSKTWLDNNLPWFNTPKGFGRYTRNKGGAKESESNSSSASKTEKSSGPSGGGSGGSGGGGGGGGKKKPNADHSALFSSILVLGTLSFVSLFIGGNKHGR